MTMATLTPPRSDTPEGRLSPPILQLRLNRLPVDGSISLEECGVERLFGHNDVGVPRPKRFAKGHDFIVIHSDQGLTFRKMKNNKRH
jgi:hypothetical protein